MGSLVDTTVEVLDRIAVIILDRVEWWSLHISH